METHRIDDEKIRELCSKAIAANEAEAEVILAELQAALRERAKFVRHIAAETLNHMPERHSRSKAASIEEMAVQKRPAFETEVMWPLTSGDRAHSL